jgi:hypothetical protein
MNRVDGYRMVRRRTAEAGLKGNLAAEFSITDSEVRREA